MAIDKITTPAIADDAVTNAKVSYNNNQFRNIIINGDMSIAQRGTSASSLTGSGYNTVDRFRLNFSSLGTWTQSQSTDVPTGQGFATSLKMDCTTADASPSASDRLLVQQIIEGQMLQYLKKGTSSAESLTLSFWVKSTKTGTNIVELFDDDNTRQISKSYTINSTNTWEKKTITYPGDTTGAFGNDNNASLYLGFYLGAGSTYTSGTLQTSWGANTNANRAVGQVNHADSTDNEWYITGMQLEAGSVASDFEFLPVDVNLERCQRYFETNMSYGVTPANPVSDADANIYGSAGAFVSSACRLDHFFLTRKRTSPTMTFYNVNNLSGSVDAGRWQIYDGGWSQSTSATTTGAANQNMVNIQINDTFTAGNIYLVAGGLTADAEL